MLNISSKCTVGIFLSSYSLWFNIMYHTPALINLIFSNHFYIAHYHHWFIDNTTQCYWLWCYQERISSSYFRVGLLKSNHFRASNLCGNLQQTFTFYMHVAFTINSPLLTWVQTNVDRYACTHTQFLKFIKQVHKASKKSHIYVSCQLYNVHL